MKKRVLLVSSEFPPGPGGIGQHAYSLVQALRVEHFEVVVMSPADFVSNDETRDFDSKQNFEIIRYQRIGLRTYLGRFVTTYRFLKSTEVDAIILTGKFSLWQGWLLKKMGIRKNQIAILHGSEVNLSNFILRKFTHLTISTADQIVAVSKFTKSLLPKWILKKRKVEIIPNGIELSNETKKFNVVKLDGWPKLITVGHVSPRKGQHRVIKALPALIKTFPNIKYHIIGRPVNQRVIEDLAYKLGVLENIVFQGRIKDHNDLQGYYRAADIFMLLSENQVNGDVEGFGIVALEANLNGLPVIGAKFCGVEDAVIDGHSGYLVDGNNVEEISQAVVKAIENREQLSLGSKQWAEIHDWKIIVKRYTSLIS